jgi:hypothetical protein
VKRQLTHGIAANAEGDYATCEDFCELFANNLKRFYLLSFLLTADAEKAEQCFVSSLDNCVNAFSVFQESVDCWARRVIVRGAVRLIQPNPGDTAPKMCAFHSADKYSLPSIARKEGPFARVLALKHFERFAFVLSVLERYPDQSCAILLGASRHEVREARGRAVAHLPGNCSLQVAYLSYPLSGLQEGLS